MNKAYKLFSLSKCCILLCFLSIQLLSKAQTADLIIQKTGPTSISISTPMSYTIKISNNGPTAISNAFFNDTFPLGVSNVSIRNCIATGGAVCPTSANYSISNFYIYPNTIYNFKGTIPFLPVNGSIEFTIDLISPSNATLSSFSNTATITAPSGITDPDLSTNSSTWNTVIIKRNVDIAVSNTVDDKKGYNCSDLPKSYNYTIRWINKGPIDVSDVDISNLIEASNIVITGNSHYVYTADITNVTWTTSSGTTLLNTYISSPFNFNLYYPTSYPITIKNINNIVLNFEKGDTVTLNYTLKINAPNITGCEGNIAWDLNNYVSSSITRGSAIDTFSKNDTSTIKSSRMTCTNPVKLKNVDVKVIKTVDDIKGYIADSLPKIYHYTVKWINNGPNTINSFELTDKMEVTNLFIFGQGNALFNYPWRITDVQWSSSSGTSTPIGTFPLTSGNLILPDYAYSTPSCVKTVSFFKPGDTITLTYAFVLEKPITSKCGRTIKWALNNSAEFSLSECIYDTIQNNNTASVSSGLFTASTLSCPNTDLKVLTTVNDTKGYSCEKLPKDYNYTIKWINAGTAAADSVILKDILSFDHNSILGTGNAIYNYNWEIRNVIWSSSAGLTLPTYQLPEHGIFIAPATNNIIDIIKLTLPLLKPNDTVSLHYTLTINSPTVTGCGRNIISYLTNNASINLPVNSNIYDIDNTNDNNYVYSGDFLATATDLVISTTVNPAIINSGETMTISNEFYNASESDASPAIWLDTLPSTFNIDRNSIRCTNLTGTSSCGLITYDSITRVLKQEITSMPANSGVKITFSGTVNSLYTITEYNKANAYYSCLDCVPATNFTQSNYQINGQCDSVFAGVDGDTAVYDNYNDTIFLFKLLKSKPQSGGTWFQLSGTGGIFNAVASTFIVKPRTTTSTFMYVLPANAPCPADTSIVTITILEQPTPDTIIKTIPINTTTTVCDFLPNNISDVTVAACNNSTSVNWNINSQTKCVEYNSSNIKGNDTICVSVCNTQTKVCKETNIIIIITGVPPKANDDSLIETGINTPIIINVLFNDTTLDNDSLKLCNPPIFIQPIHGTIIINPNGTITYHPEDGYTGRDSFQYIICDTDGSDTAWVFLSIKCEVSDTCCDIPNAFSPNGDGNNDIFRIRCSCVLAEFYLAVYNRWGNKVFESRDVNIGWDGKYKNKTDQVEVYGYYLEYRSACGVKKITKKGNVTLLE